MEEKKLLRAKKFNPVGATPPAAPSAAAAAAGSVIMTASGPVTRKKKGPVQAGADAGTAAEE